MTVKESSSSATSGSAAVRPAPERLVAIGDLHGDLDAARRALRLAGAVDGSDASIGGKLVVVQTGDEIDRGDDDRKILDLFDALKGQAAKAGGEVLALVGNHEIMNAELDFRYVTAGGFSAFGDVNPGDESVARATSGLEPPQRGRAAAFLPGGKYARTLAQRPVTVRVGDTVFVHGGIEPKYARLGLGAINDGARSWLEGGRPGLPKELKAEDGPLWSRTYSAAPGREECAILDDALGILHARRMVVGHTPQKPEINPACDGKVWRIDTGMSKHYGGAVQVLELRGDAATVLKEPHR